MTVLSWQTTTTWVHAFPITKRHLYAYSLLLMCACMCRFVSIYSTKKVGLEKEESETKRHSWAGLIYSKQSERFKFQLKVSRENAALTPALIGDKRIGVERCYTPKFCPPTFLGGKEPKNRWVIMGFEFPAKENRWKIIGVIFHLLFSSGSLIEQ